MGIFIISSCSADREAYRCCHSCVRTAAKASENVGCSFLYQAVDCIFTNWFLYKPFAHKLTMLNNPISEGVVNAMARSLHCRCVSTPRCSLTSLNVTSMLQRLIKYPMISSAGRFTSVDSKATGFLSPCPSFLPPLVFPLKEGRRRCFARVGVPLKAAACRRFPPSLVFLQTTVAAVGVEAWPCA